MTETNEVWTGEASKYDRTRPTPPSALLDRLTQLIHSPHPALVDLGSGIAPSTAIWGERAPQMVIGIKSNADMHTQVVCKIEHHPYAAHITYREGVAHWTGLPDKCADSVTCAQSLH